MTEKDEQPVAKRVRAEKVIVANAFTVQGDFNIGSKFGDALEHLEGASLSKRVHGIHALERIAKGSKRDHWPIMEVLTCFVREKARWEPKEEDGRSGNVGIPAIPTLAPPLPADIQAILTVLARRDRTHEKEDQCLNLNETDLRMADLRQAPLERVKLSRANLSWANLYDANLSGANLRGASLSWANLRGANLSWANLNDANLSGAFLNDANLSRACLSNTNLGMANLSNSDVDVLGGADLTGADLTGADLSRDGLFAALGFCPTQDPAITDFEGSMWLAVLSRCNLSDARYDERTIWPKGFDPKEHGAIFN